MTHEEAFKTTDAKSKSDRYDRQERREESGKLPPADYLKECLSYSEKTGALFWRARPPSHFKHCKRDKHWEARRRNARCAGNTFGSVGAKGYVRGSIDGVQAYAHRVIWKMVHDDEPENIDHLNGDAGDNRLENLRACTHSENQRNQKLSTNNTSGVQGVFYHRQSGGWFSRITAKDGQALSKYSKSKSTVIAWRRRMERTHGYTGRAHHE